MAGRIPQSFIDELITRVDIVDVIDRRVQLKKTGREYQACCPFHTEKTPSFTVSPVKQFYHCFGCGAHGTAIGFLMDYEHMEFVDAIESLAHDLGLEVPYEQHNQGEQSSKATLEPLYQALNRAVEFYQQQLKTTGTGDKAIEYLKQRGLTGEIAKQFLLGYAPPGWNSLSDHFKDDPLFKPMITAGVISQKDNAKIYDRFRNRIMFPIRDKRGRPVAFGGRIIDPQDNPKYLNSPETPIFHKGNELYGLYEARQSIRHLKRFMVVEGYMDVVALAQHGIAYAVATLGTAPNEQHLKILFRLVNDVVFCFDGDKAGRKAAWRALEHSLPMMTDGRQVSFLFLPEGEDPDSLVRKEGQQAFEQRIEQAMPLSEFLITHIGQDVDHNTIEGKNRIAERARPLIQKLPDNLFRQLMIKNMAEQIGISSENIIKNLDLDANSEETGRSGQVNKQLHHKGINQNYRRGGKDIARTPVRLAIAILVQNPGFAQKTTNLEALSAVSLPGIDILTEMIEFSLSNPNVTTGAFIEHWRGTPYETHLGKLSQLELPGDEQTLAIEFTDVIAHLIELRNEHRWAFLQQKISNKEDLSESEKKEWQQLLTGKPDGHS